ncbi:MAG TPA: universal stress protein [Solirubrobacterales bacterium]
MRSGAPTTETRQLLVGFEDTDRGRDALALGACLARRLGASMVVATVLRYPRHLIGSADLEVALARDTAEAFAFVDDELADLGPRTVAVADGSPAAALQRIAAAERADLIVVGSASHAGHRLVRPGTVGTALLHGAPFAVAVAPRGFSSRPGHLRRIGVAFDGSPESWSALETGIALSAEHEATLAIVAVAEPPTAGFSEVLDANTAGRLFAARSEEMEHILDLGRKRVPEAIDVAPQLLEGPAAARIVSACAELDLLLLGSRGYGPLRHTLLGSVSRAVIAAAPCPVLVLPRAAGRDPLGLLREPDRGVPERPPGVAAGGVMR